MAKASGRQGAKRTGMPEAYFDDRLLPTSPFWAGVLARLSRPTTRRMLQRIDPNFPCGVNPSAHGVSFAKAGDEDSLCDSLFKAKLQGNNHSKIVLIRAGEFFETFGVDACVLSEAAGLQPMAGEVAKAGCPVANIQATVDCLIEAGHAVVIVEQREGVVGRKNRKVRYVADVLSASNPVYVTGLLLERSRDVAFRESPPVFALAEERRGLLLVEIRPEISTTQVMEGLTFEAARSRIARFAGCAIRLLAHPSIAPMLIDVIRRDLVTGAGHNQRRSDLLVERVDAAEGPQAIAFLAEEAVRLDMGLPASHVFERVTRGRTPSSLGDEHRPSPLYLGTASQLGLVPTRGVPDLAAHVLPAEAPAPCLALARELLISPPPVGIARLARRLTTTLAAFSDPLPDFRVSSPGRFAKTISSGEASTHVLGDLLATCDALCDLSRLGERGAAILSLAEGVARYLSGFGGVKDGDSLDEIARRLAARLSTAIPREMEADQDLAFNAPPGIPQEIFSAIDDDFRGRVLRTASEAVSRAYDDVERSAKAYAQALADDLVAKDVGPLVYEAQNCAVWIRAKSSITPDGLIRPRDRKGKPADGRLSTDRVEDALAAYKGAAQRARSAVAAELAGISQELAPELSPIRLVVTASTLLKASLLHIREASARGWSLEVSYAESSEAKMVLRDFFPYWLDRRDATLNSLEVSGLTVLTGANMAGKSSLLRAVASMAVTAASGLFGVPAAGRLLRKGDCRVAGDVDHSQASSGLSVVPYWDLVFLRTGAQDDPSAGLSAFAVEMSDVRHVVTEATERSIVLIDELGRTTESTEGAALAGAVLAYLTRARVTGIFATHFHELYGVMDLSAVRHKHMESSGTRATHRVMEGRMDRSLAFEAAETLGISPSILVEARDIAARLRPNSGASLAKSSIDAHGAGGTTPAPSLEPTGGDIDRRHTVAGGDTYLEPSGYRIDNAASELLRVSGVSEGALRRVGPTSLPAPSDLGVSVVYVLRTPGGYYYVGETDDVEARIAQHRRLRSKRHSEFVYVTVNGGKSVAREIEATLIRALRQLGFPMLSTADGRHRSYAKRHN